MRVGPLRRRVVNWRQVHCRLRSAQIMSGSVKGFGQRANQALRAADAPEGPIRSTVPVPRTGSANYSASGERARDNDLIVIRDVGAAAKFEAHFERTWNVAEPMIEFAPAIKALEPK